MRNASWRAWILLSPLLLWLALFVIAPMLILLIYSFCQRDEFGDIEYSFTWENFARAFGPLYLKIFLRSTWYAALSTIICVIVGFPLPTSSAHHRECGGTRCCLPGGSPS